MVSLRQRKNNFRKKIITVRGNSSKLRDMMDVESGLFTFIKKKMMDDGATKEFQKEVHI